MWSKNWRETAWSQVEAQAWDLLIIGGGITGAGIFREAARLGCRVLLVEQKDFAWGTSSRSSKLVHGGFRYLKEGKIGLTRASVGERNHLVNEAAGLIDPLGFLMTIYKGDHPGKWTMKVGLSIYDLLALRWNHETFEPQDFQMLAPHVCQEKLVCGFKYGDALTDDARLVIRLIQEGAADGGVAINYARAADLLWTQNKTPRASGAVLSDQVSGQSFEAHARVVINATGAWADRLRAKAGASPRIRPLRGSHLIFPGWRVPAAQAIALWHPIDGRPVFVFPWEGITLIGTTDVDHDQNLDEEPSISPHEAAYLMAAAEALFPSLNLTLADAIASYSGVRPVIGSGKADPSRESREHVIWEENGLLTVTGGKLTTFRLIAHQVLEEVSNCLPDSTPLDHNIPVFDPFGTGLLEELKTADGLDPALDENVQRRLLGRYGANAPTLIASVPKRELLPVQDTQVLWAELRWAARCEGVVHLDDLLLRRVRLGLLLPEGGRAVMPGIRAICQGELGWDADRWEAEEKAYYQMWEANYRPPQQRVPDWKAMLAETRKRAPVNPAGRRRRKTAAAGALLGVAVFLAAYRLLKRPSF